jgi:hypothetical protein
MRSEGGCAAGGKCSIGERSVNLHYLNAKSFERCTTVNSAT